MSTSVHRVMSGTEEATSNGRSRATNFTLSSVLIAVMVSSTFQLFVLTVLASRFLADFSLTRFELGMIGSINTAVGAVTAPATGRLTDWIGAKSAAVSAQLVTVAGLLVMAIGPNIWWFVASAVILGIPQGWGNPATNALIAERVPIGGRGTITGIKQSGVQLSIFLAGTTLPALDVAFGWRRSMLVYAAIFGVFTVITMFLPASVDVGRNRANNPTTAAENVSFSGSLRRGIYLVALYALLMGTAAGATSRFLALFAEEGLGWSTGSAGLVVALTGLVGIGVRIVAARAAETRIAPMKMLAGLSTVAIVVSVGLWLTPFVGSWLLIPTAMIFPVGFSAWNAVAMLAIIMAVPASLSGRASGIVLFGFLGGLAIGGPVAGMAIDATGGAYSLVWIGSAVLAALSVMAANAAQRQVQ